MPKFFVNEGQIKDGLISIIGDDVSHISRVLRMAQGDLLTVCDKVGDDYHVRIQKIDKAEIIAEILEKYPCKAEPNVEAVLFQCMPKQGKMEYIIQKTTELGVSKIVPVFSKRCVVRPTGKLSDKIKRWQKIALEAAKQSGRGVVPKVLEPVGFKEAIDHMLELEKAFMLYEEEENNRIKSILQEEFKQIGFIVGPEGGFDESEAAFAKEKGIPAITLGNRILRTETAGAAVLPIIMYSQNDI